jgi:transcriptional regulator GlxA family with amidase domain
MNRKRVGILVFPEVEVLDFCGPFEVFSVTRLEAYSRDEPSPFEVFLVAEQAGPVTATGGLKVIPDYTLETCPPLDILLVPGGWGTRAERKNARLVAWIAGRAKQVETLTSVCTGSLLLGQAGLLDGRRATTHWSRARPDA